LNVARNGVEHARAPKRPNPFSETTAIQEA
jgi:hypothetical protein